MNNNGNIRKEIIVHGLFITENSMTTASQLTINPICIKFLKIL